MNSYLVRIYRKAENNPRLLVGVVEEVGKTQKIAFNDLYELWEILNPATKENSQNMGTKEPKRNQKRSWRFL